MPLPLYKPAPTVSLPNPKEPRFIAIAAGKGGVGKSTVTLQLARCLAKQGQRVGILDADLYGPSMRHMLPENALPGRKNGKLTLARCGEIGLMSLAYFRPEQEAIAVRAPIANQLIAHFLRQVDWEECSTILVDFPPGTGDIQLSLCQQVSFAGALLVTTPQLVSLLDVRKAASLFQHMQVPLLGVVENMSYYIDPLEGTAHYLFGKEGGRQLADELGVALLGQIPISPALCQACDLGTSLFEERSLDAITTQKACLAITARVMDLMKTAAVHEIQEITFPTSGVMAILWKSGQTSQHVLRALQRKCPCAACVIKRQEAPLASSSSEEPLLIDRVTCMGHYGLKFDFQSGCSFGLYPLALIRSL